MLLNKIFQLIFNRNKQRGSDYSNDLGLSKGEGFLASLMAQTGDISQIGASGEIGAFIQKNVIGNIDKYMSKQPLEFTPLTDLERADTLNKEDVMPDTDQTLIDDLINYDIDIDRSDEDSIIPSAKSPPSDEKVMAAVIGLKGGGLSAIALIESIGIITEVLTLGQVEGVTTAIQDIIGTTGLPDIIRDLYKIPLLKGVVEPYDQLMNAKYAPYVPPPTDLVRFRTREAIPTEMYEKYMLRNGFDVKWRNAYWDAHWVELGNSQIYEMFNRGIIDEDEMKAQLLIADNNPKHIDKLVEISRRLPSRTELRMILDRVDMSEELIDRILKAEGIHEDYHEVYKLFALNFNAARENNRLAVQAMTMYREGYFNIEQLTAVLKEARYTDLEASIAVESSKLKRSQEMLDNYKNGLIYDYRQNEITAEELTAGLTALQLDEDYLKSILALELGRKKTAT